MHCQKGKVRQTMRVFLTGCSVDLVQVLSRQLELRGDVPVRFDVRPPLGRSGLHVKGSILDRDTLQKSLQGVDCVVHLAAWHGFHEATGARNVYDFWDLNVTGTFYVFEAAVRADVRRIVHISSTSVSNWASVYGHTKVLGEPPDPCDDVYALGFIRYQLLMGNLGEGAPSGLKWTTPLLERGMTKQQVQLLASCIEGRAGYRPANARILAESLAVQTNIRSEKRENEVSISVAPRPTETAAGLPGIDNPSRSSND